MPPRTSAGSSELGALLRARREELGLTIEQAAAAAGLGSETWRRYEAGGAIRRDKVKGVGRALRWRALPAVGAATAEPGPPETRLWDLAGQGDGYVDGVAQGHGEECARALSLGFDLIRDWLADDIEALASRPRGTHVGELEHSWLEGMLPKRWLMRYDYEFLYRFRGVVTTLLARLKHPAYDGIPYLTRSVADDLALYLMLQQGAVGLGEETDVQEDDADEWAYELNGEDDEVLVVLFSKDVHPEPESRWHFDRWFDDVYYGLEVPGGGRERQEGHPEGSADSEVSPGA